MKKVENVRLNELKQPISEDWPDYASQREIRSMAKEILHYRTVEQHAQVWQYRQSSKNGTWSDWAYISESSFRQHFSTWVRKCRGVFEGASAEIRALGVIVPYQACAACLNTYRQELNQIETCSACDKSSSFILEKIISSSEGYEESDSPERVQKQ